MKAALLDHYAQMEGPLHRVDARAKVVMLAIFIVCVLGLPRGEWSALAVYWLLLGGTMKASRVPLRFLAARAAIVLPPLLGVGLLSSAAAGLGGSISPANKIWTNWSDFGCRGVLIAVGGLLLASTARLSQVAQGLRGIGVPWLVVALFSFTARYALLLTERAFVFRRALNARGGLPCGLARRVGTLAHASTAFILRTYERAEQVAVAMEARGYDGEMRTPPCPPLSARQGATACVGAAVLLVILIWSWAG